MPFCLDAQLTKPAFVVVERNAHYDAGDLLGRGSALWHSCGHKWGFILPRMEGTWAIQYRLDFRRLLGSVEPRRVESRRVWLNVGRNHSPRGQMSKQNSQILIGVALLRLSQSLYAAHKENQRFLLRDLAWLKTC
jgi:hypothetical protein